MVVFKIGLERNKNNHVVSQSDHCAETREEASTSKGRDRGGNPGASQLKVAPCDAHRHSGAFKGHLGASGPELKLATLCQNIAFQWKTLQEFSSSLGYPINSRNCSLAAGVQDEVHFGLLDVYGQSLEGSLWSASYRAHNCLELPAAGVPWGYTVANRCWPGTDGGTVEFTCV